MAYFGLILDFIGKLLVVISGISGFAVIVYNLVLQKLFEKLGLAKPPLLTLAPIVPIAPILPEDSQNDPPK